MKKIATGAAALSLAAGLLGLGASGAHAAEPNCSTYGTAYGATVEVCAAHGPSGIGTIWWKVDASGASTDERIHFGLNSNCGSWTWSINDKTDRNLFTYAYQETCASYGFWVNSYSTESGHYTGGTHVSADR